MTSIDPTSIYYMLKHPLYQMHPFMHPRYIANIKDRLRSEVKSLDSRLSQSSNYFSTSDSLICY